jgi:hypothetical protein
LLRVVGVLRLVRRAIERTGKNQRLLKLNPYLKTQPHLHIQWTNRKYQQFLMKPMEIEVYQLNIQVEWKIKSITHYNTFFFSSFFMRKKKRIKLNLNR